MSLWMLSAIGQHSIIHTEIFQRTIATTIVRSSQPILWYLILANSRKQTETNAKTVNVITIRSHRGPLSSARRAASFSGERSAMANQPARVRLGLSTAKVR